jgi:hypothetical protein
MSDISAYGISATVPRGWDGSITKRSESAQPLDATTSADPQARAAADDEPGTEHPVAHIANFALPPVRGDYGSGAVETMSAEDILVCIVEFDAEASDTPLFANSGVPTFRANDFAPHTMQRTIAGMCGAQAFFTEAGRAFSAYVVLGSYRGRAPMVPRVNGLLSSLRIEPA